MAPPRLGSRLDDDGCQGNQSCVFVVCLSCDNWLPDDKLVAQLEFAPPHKMDENLWKNREKIEELLYLLDRQQWPEKVSITAHAHCNGYQIDAFRDVQLHSSVLSSILPSHFLLLSEVVRACCCCSSRSRSRPKGPSQTAGSWRSWSRV